MISKKMDQFDVILDDINLELSEFDGVVHGLDVGEDSGAPVSPDYGPVGNHFNGEVKGVQLSIAEGEDEGQVVDPKDAVRAMFGRQ